MQTIHKRFSVIAGFVVLLILLAMNAVVTRRQLGVQLEDQAWVIHTQQVLFELTETQLMIREAESGQRGFLYTEDPKYLGPYNRAIAGVGPNLDQLARLIADNPERQKDVLELRGLAEKKLGELAQTIALYKAGKAKEARALVLSDEGRHYMGAIRTLVLKMEADENSLHAAREAKYQKSIGVTIWCIYLASVVAAVGLLLLAYYILREMGLREKYSREVAEREEWFRVTLSSLGDGVIATDENGTVTFLNPVAENLTGRTMEEAKGRPIHEVFPIFNEYTLQPVDNPVSKVMEQGVVVGLANHTVLRHVNGDLTPIEDSAAPIRDDRQKLVGVVLVFRDATHERKSQEILRKTEKLAAAARLAATFAHEINNPLEAVVNLVYIVQHVEGLPDAAIQPLEMAEQELERVSHITRQTLGFYRESTVRGSVELPVVIENVLKLYSNKLSSKHIRIERELAECPPVQGYTGELTQAISNLISNAADAVAERGTIRVKLFPAPKPEGMWVGITIEDNGPGIKPELAERIFEPFFTTKTDVGTGLGLWVTKEIIDRHGGTIEVVSAGDDSSGGAAFTIQLPITAAER